MTQTSVPIRARLVHGTAWGFVARAAGLIGTVFGAAFVARVLSRSDMGLFFLAGSAVNIAATVGQLGLGRVAVRRVSQALAVRGPHDAARIGVSVMGLGLAGTAVMAVLLYAGLAEGIERLVPGVAGLGSIRLPLAIWLVAAAAVGLAAQTYQGFHDLRLGSLFGGTVGPLLGAFVYGALMLADVRSTVVLVAWVTAGVAVVTAVVAVAFLARYLLPAYRTAAPDVPEPGTPRVLLVDAWPFWLNSMAMLAFAQAGIWIVAAFLGKDEVALYGAALRLIGFAAASTTIVATTIQASISELHARREHARLERTLRLAGLFGALPAAVFLVFYLATPASWLGLVFGEPYRAGVSILLWLSLGNMLTLLFGMPGIALRMMDHERPVMRVVLVTGSMAVVASLVAVRWFGVEGVAAAAAGAVVVQRATMWNMARRRLGLRTDVFALRFAEVRDAGGSAARLLLAPWRTRA